MLAEYMRNQAFFRVKRNQEGGTINILPVHVA